MATNAALGLGLGAASGIRGHQWAVQAVHACQGFPVTVHPHRRIAIISGARGTVVGGGMSLVT